MTVTPFPDFSSVNGLICDEQIADASLTPLPPQVYPSFELAGWLCESPPSIQAGFSAMCCPRQVPQNSVPSDLIMNVVVLLGWWLTAECGIACQVKI